MEEFLDFYTTYRFPLFLSIAALIYLVWPETKNRDQSGKEEKTDLTNANKDTVLINKIEFSNTEVKSLLNENSLTEADESLDEQEEKSLNLPPDNLKIQQVLNLEEKRISKGYKSGWLYYRCKEKKLLREFLLLQKEGRVGKSSKEILEDKKENKEIAPKLSIELVPSTCWFSNLRSVLTPVQWKMVKTSAYKKAKYLCEICGGHGPKWPVEAHEMWIYDDKKKIQTLDRIIALCPSCHEVKHMGFAAINGRDGIATEHMMHINQWSEETAIDYIKYQFDIWDWRSNFQWKTDLSCLKIFKFTEQQILDLQLKAKKERL